MVSALGYALLGLLARAPATGYDLTRLMDRSLAYFWSARHSQIYPELARLERSGHLRHTEIPGAGPRATKRYELTSEGKAALVDWIGRDPEDTTERDPTLLRISSLWLLDRDAAIALVDTVRRRAAEQLALYRTFAAEFDEDDTSLDPRTPDFATRATVEIGIRSQLARMDWCDWLSGRLSGR